MLKLVIVKFLSCLRFKTLKTIARSVAHNSYCFGQIQYRSQLADNAESVPAGTGVFITFHLTCVAKMSLLLFTQVIACL